MFIIAIAFAIVGIYFIIGYYKNAEAILASQYQNSKINESIA
jgi:uncharacterized protein YoxC